MTVSHSQELQMKTKIRNKILKENMHRQSVLKYAKMNETNIFIIIIIITVIKQRVIISEKLKQ